MKRRAGNVALFLLLGAILNVAFAWILFRLEEIGQPQQPVVPSHRWIALRPFGDTAVTYEFVYKSARGVSGWYGHSADEDVAIDIAQAGWPLRALEGGMWSRHKPIGNHAQVVATHYQWARPMRFAERSRYLPLCPIWPGFAINAILYAAVLWMLFAFPFSVRRSRRIKRGLCPKCAYDLRGGSHAACPECGKPIALRTIEREQKARRTPKRPAHGLVKW